MKTKTHIETILNFKERKYIIPYDKNGLTHGIERIIGGSNTMGEKLSDQTFCRDSEHGIQLEFLYEKNFKL